MPRFLSFCLLVLLASPLIAAEPIADYPFQTDAADATGLNFDCTLINAPFQDGGVWCNGIYRSNDHLEGSHIRTPSITAMDLDSFAVSVEFNLEVLPDVGYRPVLIGGSGARWMGVEVAPDGEVVLLYNNSNHTTGRVNISTDEWHTALVTYDGTIDELIAYIDGELTATVTTTLEHYDQKVFMMSNGSTSVAFWGLWRNLIVYDGPFTPVAAQEMSWGELKRSFR